MVPFAGWDMPVQYRGIVAEHRAVRTAAGLFDVCHMGEITLRGPRAGAALDLLCVNDPRTLTPGRAMYSPLCLEDGGTQDDVIVYCLRAQEEYLLVVNAANRAADLAWIRETLGARGLGDVQITDASEQTGLVALQGPAAMRVLAVLLAEPERPAVVGLRPFRFTRAAVAGVPCLVARTGYTGEDGVELACSAEGVVELWDATLAAGTPLGLEPCGLGARDTLRLEAGLPLYGHELSAEVSPLEAGLGRFVRLDGRTCVGSQALARQAAGGPPRHLVGLEPEPPGIARAGALVRDADGRQVGLVTSGTFSPSLGRPVAMALCARGAAAPGEVLGVEVRGRAVPARVVSLPFYRRRRDSGVVLS